MSAVTQAGLDAFRSASSDEARKAAAVGKKALLDGLRDVVSTDDLVTVERCFELGLAAKVRSYVAANEHDAREASDEVEANLDAVEELVLRYEIVGKATVARLARSLMHQAISGAFAVGGAVLQAALATLFPGGGLVGAGINAGVQHVVAWFLGPDPA